LIISNVNAATFHNSWVDREAEDCDSEGDDQVRVMLLDDSKINRKDQD